MPDEKIIQRISALLAKAQDQTGTTEEERDAFMAKATAMMSKHNISQAELSNNERSAGGDVTTDIIEVRGVEHQWKTYFYNSIAGPSFVKVIYVKQDRKLSKVWLFGRPDNLAFTKQLADYLIPWLETECKRKSRELKREAQETGQFFNPKAFKRSFMQAASTVIHTRLVTLRKDTGTPYALVTNEEAANMKAVAKVFPKLRTNTRRGSRQLDGHVHGAAAGRNADLSPGRKLNA